MANFRDSLHQSPEFQAATQAAQEQAPETPREAVQPVLQLEKGDMEFWMQVTTTVLLFLIWRELAAQGGR